MPMKDRVAYNQAGPRGPFKMGAIGRSTSISESETEAAPHTSILRRGETIFATCRTRKKGSSCITRMYNGRLLPVFNGAGDLTQGQRC